MNRRIMERRGQFKKTTDDPRRKREDIQVQIRKSSRDSNLQKKRINDTVTPQIFTESVDLDNSETLIGSESLSHDKTSYQSDYSTVPLSDDYNFSFNNNTSYREPEINAPDLGFGRLSGELSPTLPEDQKAWEDMVASVMSDNPTLQFEGSMKFRKLLSIEKNPPIQAVINSGVVPRFVEFLKDSSRPNLQFEAAWTLTNVASGTTVQTDSVVSENAIPIFVSLIRSPRPDVSEQAVWALGNIAGDCHTYRDMVLETGGLPPLLERMAQDDRIPFLRNATWAISNFCRGKPAPSFEAVAPCLPILKALLDHEDEEILSDCCWALSYLSDGDENKQIQAVINAGIAPLVIKLLSHNSSQIQTPALRTVGNIVTGNDAQTQVIIDFGAVPKLRDLLFSPKRTLRKEACWAISNITAGTQAQIQQVIDQGIIPIIIELLSGTEYDIQKEAAWAISNAATGGNAYQVDFIVQCGCIPPICELLKINDAKIISISLDAIENILRIGNQKKYNQQLLGNPYYEHFDQNYSIPAIESLQDHENQNLSKKALLIMTEYFLFEEENSLGLTGEGFAGLASVQSPQGGFDFGTS